MSILNQLKSLPDTAKDIRVNLLSVMDEDNDTLSLQSRQAILLSVLRSLSGYAGVSQLVSSLEGEIQDEKINHASQIAHSMMAMNNIYYRFVHLSESKELQTMPPGLRMQAMRQHEVGVELFELMSLAISAVNGCGLCISSHIKQLQKHGVSMEVIQMAGKIAALTHAWILVMADVSVEKAEAVSV